MKKFIVMARACVAFTLCVSACPVRAVTYPVDGTEGFETGLHLLAYLVLDHTNLIGGFTNNATIQWNDGTFTSPGLLTCEGLTNDDPCYVLGTHRYGRAGTYEISITYQEPDLFGNGTTHTVTTTATVSPPTEFVILSIGDSVASGEGNPVEPFTIPTLFPFSLHFPKWGFWDDAWSNYDSPAWPDHLLDEEAEWHWNALPADTPPIECHRSKYAGPALAAQKVLATNPGVTFVHYACSGAKIHRSDTAAPNAQDIVGQLRVARQRLPRIDVLIISAGANSLYGPTTFGNGFGGLVNYCLWNFCKDNAAFKSELSNAFNALPDSYVKLAQAINCINPDNGAPEPSCTDPKQHIPKLVLVTEYMDPTHKQDGSYPVFGDLNCPPLFNHLSFDDWVFFHDSVVQPLNQIVRAFPSLAASAELFVPKYAVTGIADDFRSHGLCAGDQRWVLNGHDSEVALGYTAHPKSQALDPNPLLPLSLNGTAHPNAPGHAAYRDRIYQALVERNPPATVMSATAGGVPYASGTWTDQDVDVTLTADNAIQESGVGNTFYAVDNPNCKPNAEYPYPPDNTFPDNPPGCLTYGSAITLTDNGRHTLTFFSHNALNFPEGVQTVQVAIDKNPPLAADPGTQTVHRGESAEYNITVGHVGWSGATVDLSCETDAPLATCSLSTDSVSLDADVLTATATVTTSAGARAAIALGSPVQPTTLALLANLRFAPLATLRATLAFAAGALLFGLGLGRRRRWFHLSSLVALTILGGALAGCSGSGDSNAPGTYTVTITGTSGTTTNTLQRTLVVNP